MSQHFKKKHEHFWDFCSRKCLTFKLKCFFKKCLSFLAEMYFILKFQWSLNIVFIQGINVVWDFSSFQTEETNLEMLRILHLQVRFCYRFCRTCYVLARVAFPDSVAGCYCGGSRVEVGQLAGESRGVAQLHPASPRHVVDRVHGGQHRRVPGQDGRRRVPAVFNPLRRTRLCETNRQRLKLK